MTTRAWLAVMATFAAGWMTHDASVCLRALLGGLQQYLSTGFGPIGGGPC